MIYCCEVGKVYWCNDCQDDNLFNTCKQEVFVPTGSFGPCVILAWLFLPILGVNHSGGRWVISVVGGFGPESFQPRPQWLSWMRRLTGDPCPAEVGNILSWRLIMKYFLWSFSPFLWFKKGSCQFLAQECAQYWLTVWRTKPAQWTWG